MTTRPGGRETSGSFVARLPRPLRPLSRRLSLLVVSIVAVLMGAVLSLAFQRLNRLAVEAAGAHLQASSEQLVSTLEIGAMRLRRDVARLAASRGVTAATSPFATTSDVAAGADAIRMELARTPQTASIGIWSADGRLVVAAGDTGIAASAPPSFAEEATDTSSAAALPLATRGDSVYVAVAGRSAVAGARAGAVVVTRRMQGNPESLALLRGLVGPDARILLGNYRGDVWTDLSRRVDDVGAVKDSGLGQHTRVDGISYLHSIASIPGTPWQVMVEAPRRWATATAGGFVLEMAGLGVILLLAGAIVLWLAIRRSLEPLHAVTQAVAAIAHGDSTQPVAVTSDDEFGRLAVAFNSMASQVHASRLELGTRAEALQTANLELLESEERYRALVDHLPDGILVHWDQRITFANRASAELFGVPDPGALVGASMLDFIDSRDVEVVAGRLSDVQEHGTPALPRDLRLRRASGRAPVVEARSIRLTTAAKNAVQTILHDVTDRRLLEEQLRQSQKMEAVGRLAGGVAHDFSNILTVIDAHAEFARNPRETPEARVADIDEIQRASASAARLTRQLLAFSRKQSVVPVRVDLNTTVNGLLGMLQRLIGEGVAIAAELETPLWAVQADAGQMDQVVMNLSVNARDAMPHGGRLSFRTKNVRVGQEYRTATGELVPEGEYVMLSVEDSGGGMTDDVQTRIFEPFFTTKQPGQGTGLGLSTVYGIVKQSGGYIWVYSEVGKGTAFKILLPRFSGEGEEHALTRTSEHRVRSVEAQVLLVEDHESVRLAISRALRAAGFVVHEAGDVDQAERILADDSQPVDLIITDMMMPGRTGAELASGAVVSQRGIPVVIMSGYSEEFTNREWRLPPNATFVDKPVSPASLIRLVSELLG